MTSGKPLQSKRRPLCPVAEAAIEQILIWFFTSWHFWMKGFSTATAWRIGVPTFKNISLGGWCIFQTIFNNDFKNVKSIKIGPCPTMCKLCMSCLLNFAGQSLCTKGGLCNQKIKKGTFLRIEKLGFWESPVKIRDIVGTPKVNNYQRHHYLTIS